MNRGHISTCEYHCQDSGLVCSLHFYTELGVLVHDFRNVSYLQNNESAEHNATNAAIKLDLCHFPSAASLHQLLKSSMLQLYLAVPPLSLLMFCEASQHIVTGAMLETPSYSNASSSQGLFRNEACSETSAVTPVSAHVTPIVCVALRLPRFPVPEVARLPPDPILLTEPFCDVVCSTGLRTDQILHLPSIFQSQALFDVNQPNLALETHLGGRTIGAIGAPASKY
jgi:hypothetical protein